MYQPSTNKITIKKQPQPSNPPTYQFLYFSIDNTLPLDYNHLRTQIHIYYLNPFILFYFITHTPPIRPRIYNIYAIFHSFIISITTIYYVHIYYLTHLLSFTPLLFYFILFYCIHATYEIHCIQFLRYISFSYYHYYYYTIPPPVYITPAYLRHNITLLIPIVILAHHTHLQTRFSLIPHNLQR